MSDEARSRYESLIPLGSGGMATVFVGRVRGAAGFSRLVALKRAHSYVKDDLSVAAALEREARLASRIHHVNVVAVLDVFDDEGTLVLVLEYVEGAALSELVRGERPFGGADVRERARAVVRIVLDVAAGLEAAHSTADEEGRPLGIVHRDVSPSNILVGIDGVARITDFGIAKSLEASADRTDTGALKGKVAYMAPEYVEHYAAGPAGDQFSLGVVAWEALAGRRLFRSATEIETLKRVLAARVPELASIAPELAPLDAVLARGLARAPHDRFPDVAAFAAALEAAGRSADLVGSHAEVAALVDAAAGVQIAERRRAITAPRAPAPISAAPGRDDLPTVSHRARSPRPARRRRVLIASAVLAMTAGAIAVAVVVTSASPTPLRPARADEVTAAAAAPSTTESALPPDRAIPAGAEGTGEAPDGPRQERATPRASAAASERVSPRRLAPRKAPPNPYLR